MPPSARRNATVYGWSRAGGWDLVVAASRVLARDPEILAFAFLAVLVIVPLWPITLVAFLSQIPDGRWLGIPLEGSTRPQVLGAVTFVGLVVASIAIAGTIRAAIVACALRRFRGRESTLGVGFGALLREIGPVSRWSIVDAAMRMFEGRGRASWSAPNFLVLPHLVEGRDLVDARARSAQAIDRLGGRDFVLGHNLTPLFFAFYGLAAILGVLWMFVAPFGEQVGDTTRLHGWEPLWVFGPLLALLLVVGILRGAMMGIVVAAVYVSAEDGTMPAPFGARVPPPIEMED